MRSDLNGRRLKKLFEQNPNFEINKSFMVCSGVRVKSQTEIHRKAAGAGANILGHCAPPICDYVARRRLSSWSPDVRFVRFPDR
jgi:hypothetical protein